MNRIRTYTKGLTRQRRRACLKKARRRIRYAAGYLDKLLAEFETANESKILILEQDMLHFLKEAQRFVRKGCLSAKSRHKR